MRNVPVIKGLWGQRVTVVSEMPERAGYTFKGWSLSKEDTTPVTEVPLAVGGTTVYAIWAKEGNEESKPSVTPVPSETPSSSEAPSSSETPIATATPDSSSEPNSDVTPVPTTSVAPTFVPEVTPTSTPDIIPTVKPEAIQTPEGATTLKTIIENNSNEIVVPKVNIVNNTPKTPAIKTMGNVVYKLSGKTATVIKASKKTLTSVTIRDKVKIDGKTVKVTKINKNAFKGCKKLKKVTIKAKSLKSIGKNAFKGIAKKAVIKVPKAKKKAYKKLLKKAKIAKTVRVK